MREQKTDCALCKKLFDIIKRKPINSHFGQKRGKKINFEENFPEKLFVKKNFTGKRKKVFFFTQSFFLNFIFT